MPSIFLSHSSSDEFTARALARWLEDVGFDDYFLDCIPEHGLLPGERWQPALIRAAERCSVFLFILSEKWLKSPWCVAEFLTASRRDRDIFAVTVEPMALEILPRELASEWQICNLVPEGECETFRVSGDGSPTHSSIDIRFPIAGLTRLRHGLRRTGIAQNAFRWPPEGDSSPTPYRGMAPLDHGDEAVFFGREAAILRGLNQMSRLREHGQEHMLVILGASGAGKSSYLRAGLWPRLFRDDRHFVALRVIRPERSVINGDAGLVKSLEEAYRRFGSNKDKEDIRTALEAPDGLTLELLELQDLAHTRLGAGVPMPHVVVSVDQAEELFEPNDSGEMSPESQHFLSLFSNALTSTPESGATERLPSRPLAIITLRAGSLARLQMETSLAACERVIFELAALEETELKEVIEGPAQRCSAAGWPLRIHPFLTERLLCDSQGGADALPLLAFTLERLFHDYGGSGELSLAKYERIGGVRGAIAAAVEIARKKSAEGLGSALWPKDYELALRRGFIPWLARVEPDTDERLRRVARWDEIPADVRPLFQDLADARLLVRDERRVDGHSMKVPVIEIAHEALLRQWAPLSLWLDEESQALKALESARRASQDWDGNLRDVTLLLHSGERLSRIEALLNRTDFVGALSQKGRDYVAACREKQDAAHAEKERVRQRERDDARRLQRRSQIAVSLALFMTIFAGIAIAGFVKARWQEQIARDNLLVATAANLEADDPTTAALVLSTVSSNTVSLRAEALAARLLQQPPVVTLRGHQAAVMSVAFDSTSERVVSAGRDGSARVWRTDGKRWPILLLGHRTSVPHAAFDPKGLLVVTSSIDGTARIRRASGKGDDVVLGGHVDPVWRAAFSPDGAFVVTVGSDGTARLWRSDGTGTPVVFKGHTGAVVYVAFSGDGQRIVTASHDKTARIWRVDAPESPSVVLEHPTMVNSATFSPDDTRMLTVSQDRIVRIWWVDKSRPPVHLDDHEATVEDAAFSPDGKYVATAGGSTIVRVWRADGGDKPAKFEGHAGPVQTVSFSSDGARLLTAGADRTARVWAVDGSHEPIVLRGHDDTIWAAAFSPDGNQVATASEDRTVRVWRLDGRPEIAALSGHHGRVRSAAFCREGTHVLTTGEDGTVCVTRTDRAGQFMVLKGHAKSIKRAMLSPDGTRVLTLMVDGSVAIRSSNGRSPVTGQSQVEGKSPGDTSPVVVLEHRNPVISAAFSRDGSLVVTGHEDGMVRLWRASGEREPFRKMDGHQGAVLSVGFSDDSRYVVTAGQDGTARTWSVTDENDVSVFQGHEGRVFSVAFDRSGSRMLTAAEDQTARVWQIDGKLEPVILRGHQGSVFSARFSPDGTRVVTASQDRTVRVWRADGSEEPIILRGHGLRALCAAFSPDGARVISEGDDQTIRIWRPDGPDEAVILRGHNGCETSQAFSPDSTRVVVANADGAARLIPITWPGLLPVLQSSVFSCLTVVERKRYLLETQDEADENWRKCEAKLGRKHPQ